MSAFSNHSGSASNTELRPPRTKIARSGDQLDLLPLGICLAQYLEEQAMVAFLTFQLGSDNSI